MERKARADKILLLGVDGLDPRLTRKYVDMGLMPNVKKYIETGAQRHDLVLLGGHPTVTHAYWTKMSTIMIIEQRFFIGFSHGQNVFWLWHYFFAFDFFNTAFRNVVHAFTGSGAG